MRVYKNPPHHSFFYPHPHPNKRHNYNNQDNPSLIHSFLLFATNLTQKYKMVYPTAHPFFNPAQADAFNALADKTDSTFEVRYFHVHGQGGPARSIIVIGTHDHTRLKNVFEYDWADYKPTTPFGVMPLLTETSADGKTKLQVAESDAIERYLARKFGLFGNGTAFQEVLVNTFANSTQGLIMSIFNTYGLIEDPAVRAKNKGPLITDNIAPWIKYHEQHLQANGHYVGNSVTLADVKTNYVISMI
jgi:glutathione S-transferase